MGVEIKEYGSAEEIAKAVEDRISETKDVLDEYTRRLDGILARLEKSKNIREKVVKFKAAGKKSSSESLGEISVGALSIVLDANPFHEMMIIEEVVRNQQDKLVILQKIRESLKWLDQLGYTEGLKYLVLEKDGVPVRILFKIS